MKSEGYRTLRFDFAIPFCGSSSMATEPVNPLGRKRGHELARMFIEVQRVGRREWAH